MDRGDSRATWAEEGECMTEVLPVDAQIDLEFAFTSWRKSCRHPSPTMQPCRRRAGHAGHHAAGHGEQRRRWT